MNSGPNMFFARHISISAMIALSACGGGGSTDPGVPAAVPTSVSGTVSKGLVRQAKVLVCRVVNGVPEADASCAVGSSGMDGSFSVTLSDGFTGPAMVKVMASTTSTMLDETTGSYIPYNMTLRSVIPAVSSRAITYPTPFSEMATSLAVYGAVLDAFGITLAMTQVQTLISTGIDLTVKPVIDLQNSGSDPVMLGKQANMVKQLARVTMMAKRPPDTFDTSGGVHCNTPGTTTTEQLVCATAAMSGAMTRGGNAAAQLMSRIIPAMWAENPTSVTMAIIKPDGTLALEVADMTSSASMEAAMLKAGMPPSVVQSYVQIMMKQMYCARTPAC